MYSSPYGTHYAVVPTGRQEEGVALGWEDIQQVDSGTMIRSFLDDTLTGGTGECTITYVAPFLKPNREQD